MVAFILEQSVIPYVNDYTTHGCQLLTASTACQVVESQGADNWDAEGFKGGMCFLPSRVGVTKFPQWLPGQSPDGNSF